MMQRNTFWLGLLAVALLGLPGMARAQQVQAGLSQDVTGVGQPVRLDIVVTGAGGAQVPPEIKVDGLDGRFVGKSTQAQMSLGSGGFTNTVTSTFSYLIVPARPGDYTIPPLAVSVGGKVVKTAPLQLRVMSGQGSVPVRPAIPVPPGQQSPPSVAPPVQSIPLPQSQAQASADEARVAFGDLIVPKRTIFVGEVVPVELRFYFDARFPVQYADRPGFSGDGFTVMNFSRPAERTQDVNGQLYNVFTFQTALTAAKAGPLEIPAATLQAAMQLPTRNSHDNFLSLFGPAPQRIDVKTGAVKLEVKALPKEGRPGEFAGAIGQFSLQADASPKKSGAGDPITLNVAVAGRGNFDAMGAPVLADAEAWRTYPPGENFQASPSDPIGFNGEKLFEYTMVARQDTEKTPAVIFSYFDPEVEKYVTLHAGPIAVEARGGAAPAAVPTVAAATPTPAATAPAAKSGAGSPLVSDFTPGTFVPLAHEGKFLVANAAVAGVWCLALVFGLVRFASNSSLAKKSAARREQQKLLRRLEDPALDAEEFHRATADFIRARLEAGGHVDPRDAVEAASLRPETKTALLDILNLQDELKYSTGGPARLGADQREKILTQVRAFDTEAR